MASTSGRRVVVPLTNKSGGGVIAGDVVVVDTTNNDAFTTSTSGAFTGLIGVAQETIASNATGRVLTSGYAALVNTSASVTRGNFGKTHTVAKQAVDAGSSRVAGAFCQFLTGGTTPDAHLFGLADNTSGAGTGTLTTVKNEGSNLSTAVASMDFVGAGVNATGTTAVTVTIGSVATDPIFDAVGDIPVGTGADTAAKGRGYVLLAETVLGADAAAITFTGLSSAYRDLIVSAVLRSAKAAATDDFRIQVGNGSIDTGSNYSFSFTNSTGTTVSTATFATQTTIYFGNGMASTGLANSWSFHEMTIRNYTSTTQFRTMLGSSTTMQNSSADTLMQLGGAWRNAAAAVDQVTVFADGGNLLSGSRVTLYGRG